MKREIKFRAWSDNLKDKGEKYYQYTSSFLNPLFSPAGYGLLNPTLKIMQYIGLKDRNGKEIYEGDILETDVGTIGYVEFLYDNCGFVLQLMGNKKGDHITLKPTTNYGPTVSIIGNIYENPDLISNKLDELS